MREHGGNIHLASRESGRPVAEIIDFSASINPLGVPESVVQTIRENIGALVHYPEPFSDELAACLGNRLGIDPDTILCGNGSTELIYLTVRALAPRKVLISSPTFSEYERACGLQPGTQVVRYAGKRGNNFDIDPDAFIDAMTGCDMAFLCNPNNPTGRILDKDSVLAVAAAAEDKSCFLVLDEAFIDFIPDQSVIDHAVGNPRLIVLRSLTKFYALSGLRIGYGVFPGPLAAAVRDYKEPWTVNTLAQKAAISALNDVAYGERTMELIRQEKQFLENEFIDNGIDFIRSAANFYLLRMEQAGGIIQSLWQKGILVRDCSNFPGLDGNYLRIAVRSRRENEVLLKELARSCVV